LRRGMIGGRRGFGGLGRRVYVVIPMCLGEREAPGWACRWWWRKLKRWGRGGVGLGNEPRRSNAAGEKVVPGKPSVRGDLWWRDKVESRGTDKREADTDAEAVEKRIPRVAFVITFE